MSSISASQYRKNVLFRLLAFLDNTGTQSFVLSKEANDDGHFLRPDVVFGEGTAVAGILAAALRALRANIRRFFKNAEEQEALLKVIGTGLMTPTAKEEDAGSAEDATPSAPLSLAAPAVATNSTRVESDAEHQQPTQETDPFAVKCVETLTGKQASLPIETTWSYMVCHPVSLPQYAVQLENELPIHLFMRLCEVLGVASPAPPSTSNDADDEPVIRGVATFSDTPFMEQMLIDGLDEWMRSRPVEEMKRMILACGVQPTVLSSAFEQQQKFQSSARDNTPSGHSLENVRAALPDALVDFVVDVVFPTSAVKTSLTSSATATPSTPAEGLQDWLLLSYEKNHETIEVDEEKDGSSESCEHGDDSQPPQKHPRSDEDLGPWQPDDGEEVLTADNIDRYLSECPRRIPREILCEKRKLISHPGITAFELENHYTATELLKLIKKEVGSMTTEEASLFMGCPISEGQIAQAARATRKAQLVEWVLASHRGAADSAQEKP